nr:ribonuclease H-like domain-containing protein [Tanacetum cinerariifolium]
MTDYSLWDVILNGDSPVPTRIVEGTLQPVAPITAEQKLARKNELKAHGTLLMALPDKHQLKFNSHKDAKILMEAIENRFGGNTKTKKVQKTLLKQQYENLSGSSSKSLDQLHDRLHKLVSQLEIHGVSLSQEDVNMKFLRSLPSEWKTRTTTQNLAFVSSSNTDSTTDSVSAAASVSAVCAKMPMSFLPNVDSLSNAVIYSFIASQSTSSQLDNEDLKQIDVDDLKEMDLRWQMAILTMRAKRFLQKTCRNLGANGHFAMSKVECYNCHRKGHFARECRFPKDSRRNGAAEPQRRTIPSYQAEEEPTNYALMTFSSSSSSSDSEVPSCSKACSKAHAQLHSQYDKLTDDFRKSQFDVISYQTGIESVEARLLVYNQNESVFEENIKLLNIEVQLRDNALVILRQKLEKAEQEMDDLKLKFQPSCGYHVVPLPSSGTFMPSKPDLVFHTASIAVETDHSAFTVQLSPTKPAQDLSYINRPTTPIIEDWHAETTIPATTLKPASPKPASSGKRKNRKACFVCKSVDHLIKDYDYHAKQMTQPTPKNHAHRVSVTVVRPVSAVVSKSRVTQPRHAQPSVTKFKSPIRRHLTRSHSPKTSNSLPELLLLKLQCLVLLRRLKFNLFSVSQMCDKKNSVLFTDTECLVLSPDIKLPDESQVLLRVLRENNMYNVNLENIVPSGDLTCFFAKATIDESNLWHRRLAHINFKIINKLVKGNLVRGLPTKVFENDNTCVACKKGYRDLSAEFEDYSDNSINEVNAAGSIVLTVGQNSLNNTNTFSAADDVGAEADFNNLESSITVIPISTTRVHKDHLVSQIIGDLSSTTQTRSMTRVVTDQGGLSQMFNDDFLTCMFAYFFSQEEPKRVHQALKDPSWIEAMQEEPLQFKMQKEDVNLKFLRSLPSEWKTHTLIWQNKTDLEDKGLDDLFKSLKIYKSEVKHSSSIGTDSHNLAFVSSTPTDSTTDSVSAAVNVSIVGAKLTAPQLDNEDLKPIDVDDLEEMDLKWQMTMLTMRARRFLQKTGRNMDANGPTSMVFDMNKVECYNCHRKGHFARECSVMVHEPMIGTIKQMRNLQTLLSWIFHPLHPIHLLIMSQTSEKAGLGYNSQVFTKAMFDCDNYYTSESDCDSWPPSNLYDRFVPSGGYHVVPPPVTGTFMPPPDLVFHTNQLSNFYRVR